MSDEDATQAEAVEIEATTSEEGNRTFTQAELDAIVKERIARERTKYADVPQLREMKANLEKSRLAAMTETEQAIESAKLEAREEARREYATKLAGAEVRAALSGIVDNPDSILDDLNLSRFIDADGDVDREAIQALQAKWSAIVGGSKKSKSLSNLGHGRQSEANSATPEQAFVTAMQDLLG